MNASARVREISRRLVPLLTAAMVAGCAHEPRPATAGDLAAARAACPPGSFVAAMAANCPTAVR